MQQYLCIFILCFYSMNRIIVIVYLFYFLYLQSKDLILYLIEVQIAIAVLILAFLLYESLRTVHYLHAQSTDGFRFEGIGYRYT